jgi:hypothetical protein
MLKELADELYQIQNTYDKAYDKAFSELYILGETALSCGDPSLILSFCHEIYAFANIYGISNKAEVISLYNSGMSLEYAEYYMKWTYGLLPKVQ